MHGMLSAAIVIGVLALVVAGGVFVAARVFVAGGRHGDSS
jgi:hypothetical protein